MLKLTVSRSIGRSRPLVTVALQHDLALEAAVGSPPQFARFAAAIEADGRQAEIAWFEETMFGFHLCFSDRCEMKLVRLWTQAREPDVDIGGGVHVDDMGAAFLQRHRWGPTMGVEERDLGPVC